MADDDPPGSKPEGGEIIQFYKAREQKADSGEIELSDWNPWAHTGGPVFPLETLPDVMRARVEERAQTTGADVSAFAVAAFMGLSAASDHRIALRPKRHDHSYYIHPVLWTMLIADPSTRKSAPVEDIASLVREIDMRAGKARDHKVEKARQQQPGLSEQDLEKKIPMARRRLLNDTTSEMLCEILSHQDCGITLFRDELSGWIGSIEKYGGGNRASGQDRSIWLAAHGGGPYRQDRIGAGSRSVGNLSCGILGAFQPQRLAEIGRLDSDGLLQRFLPVMMLAARHSRDEPIDPQATTRFKTLLADITALSPTPFLTFDDEARAVWLAFEHTMTDFSAIKDPSPAFGAFLGKQARSFGVFAMLLHMVDIATGQASRGDPIPVATAARAYTIMDRFILPHARIFYSSISSKSSGDTETIAGALLRLAGRSITVRDIAHRCKAVRGLTLAEVHQSLAPFVYNGWVTPLSWAIDNNRWNVHAGLAGKFEQEHRHAMETHGRLLDRIRAASR